MKYLLFFLCLLLAIKSQAQRTSLYSTLPYVHRDFLYYECANHFIIPPHPKAILNDMGVVVVPAPVKTDTLPVVRLLKGQATLEVYEEHNVFQIIPHSIEPVTFMCHTDTITFSVFYLTYDHAEISLHSDSDYKYYDTLKLLPNLKNNYSIGNKTIKEKYYSFQEIFFNTDTLKTRMEKDSTLAMRFHLGLSKYKEALVVSYNGFDIRVDSITVKLKDQTGKLLKTNIFGLSHGNWAKLNKLLDYQKDIKTGYSLEISCTKVFFRNEYGTIDKYGIKNMKLYQDYYYCDKSISTYSPYYEINYPNGVPIIDKDWWADDPWGGEPCKDYGIPAVFRIKFY